MDKIERRIEELKEALNDSEPGSQEAKRIVDEIEQLSDIKLKEKNAKKRHGIQILKIGADCVKTAVGVGGAILGMVTCSALERETLMGTKLVNFAMKILPKW